MKINMILAGAALLCSLFGQAQPGVAVNTDATLPNGSAMLDVKSGTRGILAPRMTALQRSQISAPAAGLLVFQTDAPAGYYYYNGTSWRKEIDLATTGANPATNSLITFDGTNWVAKSLLTGSTGGGQYTVSNMQPFLTMNYFIAYTGIFPSRSGTQPFLGEVELGGFTFAPNGFFLCNGALLPISQYMALFALLGTSYGGDGMTTFGLPNLSGRVAIHQGPGNGLTNHYIGEEAGTETRYLSVANLPAHVHPVTINPN